MKAIVVDPAQLAEKLAHEKLVSDLVDSTGKGAVLKEEDLFQKDGEYKNWVMADYQVQFEYYFKMLTDNHNKKLKKYLED